MAKNSLNTVSHNKVDVFQSIVNTIHHVASLPVSIWVLDQDKKTLRIAAAVGLPTKYVKTARLNLAAPSVIGDAFKKKRIQIVKDISSDTRWHYKEQAQEMNWRSAICVPIEANNTVIGVISVYAYSERSISELRYILPHFAKQIGVTIESDKQNELLQHILSTGEKLQSMTESLKDVLHIIVESACELTGATCAVIYPYDAEYSEFFDIENIASYGLQGTLKPSEKPRAKGGMTAYVRRKGQVIVANVEKQASAAPTTSSFIRREGIKAFMGVALKVGEDVLGVLYVNFQTPHAFAQNEKDTIKLFAQQAASALNNARLYQRIRSRIDALEKLHEAGTYLTSIPAVPGDLKDILMRIAQSAKQVLNADLIELYQYIQSRDRYELPPLQAGEHYDKFVMKDTIHKDDVICKIVQGKKPVYTANAQNSKVLTSPFTEKRAKGPKNRFVIREDIKSSAAIPLMAGTEVLGVLFANYRTPQIFSREQTKLIELFASQAAIAIRNARLFQQFYEYMQLLNGQMQALHAVAQQQNIVDVLEHVLVGINTILGVKTSSSINLYDITKDSFYAYQAAGPLKNYLLRVPPRTRGSGGTGRFIIETESSLYLGDVRKPPKGAPTIRQESINKGVCSFAALPLKREQNVLGVLFVNSQKPIVFTDGIKGILELFASQAAIAIENNRLYEQGNRDLAVKQALNDLTQKLTENIEVGEEGILELLRKSAGVLMDTDNMYIALYDEPTDMVRFGLAFVKGRKVDLAKEEGWQPRKAGKGRTEEIIRTKKPIFIPTKAESKKWYTQPGRKEYVGDPLPSWIGVPMMIGDKVLGVIATYHPTQEYVYSGDDLAILQAMANQAAIAVDSARSFESAQKRLNDQETINAIAQAISMKVGTRDLLQTIVAEIQEHLDCTHCAIFLPKKIGNEIFLVSNYTQGEFAKRIKSRRFKPGEGVAGWVFEHGEAAIVSDTLQDRRYVPVRKGGRVSRSLMVVPVKMDGKAVGVISIDHNAIDSFGEDDRRLVETVAEHVAIALEKQKRIEVLEGMQELGKTLTTEADLETLLTKVAQVAVDVLEADNAMVYQFDPGTEEFYLPVVIGSNNQLIPSKDGVVAQIMREGKIILAEDPLSNPLLSKSRFVHQQGVKSCAAVPLKYGGTPIGIIFINYLGEKHHFTPYDELASNLFADQAATAINMAGNLYNTNRQLETVQAIINAVEIHADLGKFLQNILEGMLERIKAKNGTIQLYDPKRDELVIWAKVGDTVNLNYQHIPLDVGLTGKAAKERHSIYAPDIKIASDYIGYMSGTRSEFAVPMLVGDTLVGVLNAEDPEPYVFSPYSRQLIERLGEQLAILIRQKTRAQEVEEKKLTDQVNESMGLVTAEVAHKVGNAAGKIRFITRERLQNAPNITETQRKDIQVILRNVEDMIDATDDLFKPFGAERKAEVTVQQMLSVATGQCAIPANIEVCMEIALNLPKVNVQVTKVQSYLAELLNNAIKYTKRGMVAKNTNSAQVTIIAQRASDGLIEISFTNHGPAIPSERWDSIFRVFSARDGNSQDDQSYGLGLWGARATMEQQGGNVVLRESDDVKTTFVVRLPPA